MSIDNVTPEEWDSLREVLDNVKKPAHYNKGSIEAIDYIRQQLGDDGFISYCIGNCHKYLHRYKYKNGLEDLQKGRWYLSKVIEVLHEKTNS